jgi:hypothetical protein
VATTSASSVRCSASIACSSQLGQALHATRSRQAAIFTPSKPTAERRRLRAQRQGLPPQRFDVGLQLGDALTLPHMLR